MKNICEWLNCCQTGKFKAPTERDNSKKFDARVWIQLALLNKNLKSLKY